MKCILNRIGSGVKAHGSARRLVCPSRSGSSIERTAVDTSDAPPRTPLRGIVFRHPMARPPAPHPDEQARMNVLLGLDVLDTTPEEHFDGLVNLGKCASSSSPNSN